MTIDESTIAEDAEGESSQMPSTPKEMQKSPSMPHGSFKCKRHAQSQFSTIFSSCSWPSTVVVRLAQFDKMAARFQRSKRIVDGRQRALGAVARDARHATQTNQVLQSPVSLSYSNAHKCIGCLCRKAPSLDEPSLPTSLEEPIPRAALVSLNSTAMSTATVEDRPRSSLFKYCTYGEKII
jgi:hypothetical protein